MPGFFSFHCILWVFSSFFFAYVFLCVLLIHRTFFLFARWAWIYMALEWEVNEDLCIFSVFLNSYHSQPQKEQIDIEKKKNTKNIDTGINVEKIHIVYE